MAIELRYLRHFVAAVELGGIGKAARRLNISQPGLTRSIRMLEENLKVPLFERGTKGVRPTTYGENFYARARSVIAEMERAQLEISEMRGDIEGLLTIGALPSQANFILPEATVNFLALNRHTRIKVVQKSRVEILPALFAGEFDFIFCMLDNMGLEYQTKQILLFYDRPSIIVRAAHPVLRRRKQIMENLLKYPWTRQGQEAELWNYVDSLYSGSGLGVPHVGVECQTTPYLKSLVIESDFVGVLPTNFASVEERVGLINSIVLPGMENRIPFGIQYRGDRPLSRTAQDFIRHIENVCQSMKKELAERLIFGETRKFNETWPAVL